MSLIWTRDSDSLLIRHHATSCNAGFFGDPADVESGQDSGEGAWGFKYVNHPAFEGCALPVQAGGSLHAYLPLIVPVGASGIVPENATMVRIHSPVTGKVVTCPVVDKGPGGSYNRPVDLLIACVHALGLDPKDGLFPVDVRVMGILPHTGPYEF